MNPLIQNYKLKIFEIEILESEDIPITPKDYITYIVKLIPTESMIKKIKELGIKTIKKRVKSCTFEIKQPSLAHNTYLIILSVTVEDPFEILETIKNFETEFYRGVIRC